MISISIEEKANHSTLFTAVFAQSIEALVLADKFADDNLILPALLQVLEHSKAEFKVKNLDSPME